MAAVRLTSNKISAIKQAIMLGKELQKEFPVMADAFRKGKSLRQIVEDLEISNYCSVPSSTAIEAVRYALKGYLLRFDFLNLKNYDGLISYEEYSNLAYQHRSSNLAKINRKFKRKRTKLDYKIYQKNGKQVAKASGFTLWTEEEKLSALTMATSTNKEYNRGSKIAVKNIAQKLNELYHNGKAIRTAKSLSGFFNDYNKGKRISINEIKQ
ncbi:MAG: hypothetical protein ACOYT4_02425 [Nanoarchaeota archaeon]